MSDEHLPPMPTPSTEDPQLVPGGVDADALHSDTADEGLGRDLSPDDNPAVDEVLPDEVAEPDDKTQEPSGEDDAESGTTDSPSAGQEAEDGSPEPPA
ncbi:hypothetical protein EUA93_10640 [Nocardioides oleivorans]|uniref:Uncharacterized protein n=1 Tax=Nocardioides oleivorans TaxID=273676 RepID=A0A4Q2S2Y5_9ACTN|nr:hypothetical protein [Nocardioides oleivorans]RYB94765.1 hypothetical protein EUA93_10640 [Nocardioides oleivorans]